MSWLTMLRASPFPASTICWSTTVWPATRRPFARPITSRDHAGLGEIGVDRREQSGADAGEVGDVVT